MIIESHYYSRCVTEVIILVVFFLSALGTYLDGGGSGSQSRFCPSQNVTSINSMTPGATGEDSENSIRSTSSNSGQVSELFDKEPSQDSQPILVVF